MKQRCRGCRQMQRGARQCAPRDYHLHIHRRRTNATISAPAKTATKNGPMWVKNKNFGAGVVAPGEKNQPSASVSAMSMPARDSGQRFSVGASSHSSAAPSTTKKTIFVAIRNCSGLILRSGADTNASNTTRPAMSTRRASTIAGAGLGNVADVRVIGRMSLWYHR